MGQLEMWGVGVRRSVQSPSVKLEGLPSDGRSHDTTVLELTLPQATAIRASFSREGFGAKVAKVFVSELQTGDAEFDAGVYIKTSTPDTTAGLLRNDEARKAIGLLIASDGSLEIDGARVKCTLPGSEDGDDPTLLTVVRVLMG